jgi:hypothetical protein
MNSLPRLFKMSDQIDEIENFICSLEEVLKSPGARLPTTVHREHQQQQAKESPRAVKSSDRLYNMQAFYDRKTERLRKRVAKQQEAVGTSARLNPRSASLAAKHVASGKVQDRLHDDSIRRKQVRVQVAVNEAEISRAQAKPAITPMAARMKREGSVSDRLQLYNELYRDRRQHLMQKFLEAEAVQPPVVKRALSPRPQPIKKRVAPVEEPTYKPAVNKRSEQLAKHLVHSSTRLTLPRKAVKTEQPVFKPTINKRSQRITSITPRWESLHQLKEQQAQKLDDLRAEALAKQVDVECTFRPRTTRPAKPLPAGEFVKRQTAWQKSIAAKVGAQQLSVADKDLEGCTFAPKINSLPASYHFSKTSSEQRLRPASPEREVHREMSKKDFEHALVDLHAQLHSLF